MSTPNVQNFFSAKIGRKAKCIALKFQNNYQHKLKILMCVDKMSESRETQLSSDENPVVLGLTHTDRTRVCGRFVTIQELSFFAGIEIKV